MRLVYFIHAPSVNLIKIGSSRDPEGRLVALRLLSPVPLEIMSLMGGGYERETELHRQFAHLRSHGEWFHAARELTRFIWRNEFVRAWAALDDEDRQWARALLFDGPVADNTVALRAVT
jgi:hypothetical protein